MDEFFEIQASLRPARDDNDDRWRGADAHDDRRRGNYANDDRPTLWPPTSDNSTHPLVKKKSPPYQVSKQRLLGVTVNLVVGWGQCVSSYPTRDL